MPQSEAKWEYACRAGLFAGDGTTVMHIAFSDEKRGGVRRSPGTRVPGLDTHVGFSHGPRRPQRGTCTWHSATKHPVASGDAFFCRCTITETRTVDDCEAFAPLSVIVAVIVDRCGNCR